MRRLRVFLATAAAAALRRPSQHTALLLRTTGGSAVTESAPEVLASFPQEAAAAEEQHTREEDERRRPEEDEEESDDSSEEEAVLDCGSVAEAIAQAFADEDARELASVVRSATTPTADFGERVELAARTALDAYDDFTVDVADAEERSRARAELASDVANALAPAHAAHVAALRSRAAADARRRILDDDVEQCAAIAAEADIAFRAQVQMATPERFADVWQPTLDAAYDALQDDVKDVLEEVLLEQRNDDFLDDDVLDEEERDTSLKGRLRSALAFLTGNPRFLRTAGFLLNLVQARAAIRNARAAADRRDDSIPKLPLF